MRQSTCIALFLLAVATVASAQDSEPYPRISEEAFKSRLPFFDHNPSIPLEARVVREWNDDTTTRQKFVFRGAQGFLVPGYVEWPKSASAPTPLVLLLHGWSGGKEDWWKDGNMISGGEMRQALLDAGYAVLALDAATHGERSNEIDYQHVNPFDDKSAPPRSNYFSYAEISIQTVKDYRRALDYIATRPEFDSARIGLVGYSMGGMDSFYLLSVESRIKMAVACVPPFYSDGYGSAQPVDYSWGIGQKPFLLLMALKDTLYVPDKVKASYTQYIESPNSKIIWYDQDHKLTPVYVPDALAWVKEKL